MLTSYVISLNKQIALLNNLKNDYNLNPILVKGINGKKLKQNEIKKNTTSFYSNFGPKSVIGCAMSHIKTWKLFLKSNDDICIIFEDDVVFEKRFKYVNKYINNTPSDFDIILLGCLFCNDEILSKFTNVCNIKINKYINTPSLTAGLHAYVLSRKGANKLLYLIENKINDHIDVMIFKFYSKKKINLYMVSNRIAYQTSTNTCNSENANIYPYILNKFFSFFEIDKMVRLNYITSVHFLRIFNFNISTITVLFLILGIIFKINKVSFKNITLFFILISSIDILKFKNFNNIIFHYLILILPNILIKK